MACFTWKNEYYHYIFERVGYLENNVRVSLLIGIQVIPLDLELFRFSLFQHDRIVVLTAG